MPLSIEIVGGSHDDHNNQKENNGNFNYSALILRMIRAFYQRRFSLLVSILAIGYLSIYEKQNATKKYLPRPADAADSKPIKTILEGGYVSTGTISGSIFTGTPYRTYTGKRMFQNQDYENHNKKKLLDLEQIQTKYLGHYYEKNNPQNIKLDLTCQKWAVVTTIFPPSEALIDISTLQDWCTVVIGDTKTAQDWLTSEPRLNNNPRVVFMSLEEQLQWLQHLPGDIGLFLKHIPYKHFARKNIGFLYAILQKATFVYDFDDDNYLNKDSSNDANLLPLIDNEQSLSNVRLVEFEDKDITSFNHHPLMETMFGNSSSSSGNDKENIIDKTSWARGFPLELIQDTKTHGTVTSTQNTIPMSKIGVIQYCANNNPDIDAIHRLTKPLPMNFGPDTEPIMVPPNVYSPYNAQATIHTNAAMFASLLPITVTSRVTDIWRGFFAQTLFKEVDLALVFAPPRITQYRNVHNILGDLESEKDLYYKSGKLVEFLAEYQSQEQQRSLPGMMEDLWIQLYERGYIELKDVGLVQLWLGTLVQIQYPFRSIQAHA